MIEFSVSVKDESKAIGSITLKNYLTPEIKQGLQSLLKQHHGDYEAVLERFKTHEVLNTLDSRGLLLAVIQIGDERFACNLVSRFEQSQVTMQALCYAAFYGMDTLLRTLLKHQTVGVSVPTDYQRKLLLSSSFSEVSKVYSSRSALLYFAVLGRQKEVAALIIDQLEHDSLVNVIDAKQLADALLLIILQGDTYTVKQVVDALPSNIFEDHNTFLKTVVSVQNFQLIEFFLEKKKITLNQRFIEVLNELVDVDEQMRRTLIDKLLSAHESHNKMFLKATFALAGQCKDCCIVKQLLDYCETKFAPRQVIAMTFNMNHFNQELAHVLLSHSSLPPKQFMLEIKEQIMNLHDANEEDTIKSWCVIAHYMEYSECLRHDLLNDDYPDKLERFFVPLLSLSVRKGLTTLYQDLKALMIMLHGRTLFNHTVMTGCKKFEDLSVLKLILQDEAFVLDRVYYFDILDAIVQHDDVTLLSMLCDLVNMDTYPINSLSKKLLDYDSIQCFICLSSKRNRSHLAVMFLKYLGADDINGNQHKEFLLGGIRLGSLHIVRRILQAMHDRFPIGNSKRYLSTALETYIERKHKHLFMLKHMPESAHELAQINTQLQRSFTILVALLKFKYQWSYFRAWCEGIEQLPWRRVRQGTHALLAELLHHLENQKYEAYQVLHMLYESFDKDSIVPEEMLARLLQPYNDFTQAHISHTYSLPMFQKYVSIRRHYHPNVEEELSESFQKLSLGSDKPEGQQPAPPR